MTAPLNLAPAQPGVEEPRRLTIAGPVSAVTCRCPHSGCGCTNRFEVHRLAVTAVERSLLPCPDCRGDGHVPALTDSGLDEANRLFHQSEWARRAVDSYRDTVPEQFRGVVDDHPQVSGRVERFRRGVSVNLVLNGPIGTRKTTLAYSLLNQLVEELLVPAGQVWHGTEGDLFAEVALGTFADMRASRQRLWGSGRIRVMLIDDVGRGEQAVPMRPETRIALYDELIDAFWRSERMLILTTNMSGANLARYLSPAAQDRLFSRSKLGSDGEEILTLHGSSLRPRSGR